MLQSVRSAASTSWLLPRCEQRESQYYSYTLLQLLQLAEIERPFQVVLALQMPCAVPRQHTPAHTKRQRLCQLLLRTAISFPA